VDTGVLLAAADRHDPAHKPCRDLLESHPGPLITTELVLAETGWLLDRHPSSSTALAFMRSGSEPTGRSDDRPSPKAIVSAFSGPAPASAGLLAAGLQAFVDDGYRSHVDPVV
jgi:PIN domain